MGAAGALSSALTCRVDATGPFIWPVSGWHRSGIWRHPSGICRVLGWPIWPSPAPLLPLFFAC